MLTPIEKNIEYYAGKEVCGKVMEGSEEITEKTDKKKMALWTKSAMERLDASVDEKTRIQIMNKCGSNCAEINKRVTQKALERRRKFKTFEEFLKAEIQRPRKQPVMNKTAVSCFKFILLRRLLIRCVATAA